MARMVRSGRGRGIRDMISSEKGEDKRARASASEEPTVVGSANLRERPSISRPNDENLKPCVEREADLRAPVRPGRPAQSARKVMPSWPPTTRCDLSGETAVPRACDES